MTVVVLMLVVGLIALGLPTVTHRDEKRFWHPWLNAGLLPLVAGMLVARRWAPRSNRCSRPCWHWR